MAGQVTLSGRGDRHHSLLPITAGPKAADLSLVTGAPTSGAGFADLYHWEFDA